MLSDDALLEELASTLRAEFGDELLGILVTGSRIHGKPGPTSDLDVHVLLAGTRRRRCNRVIRGVEVEMFLNPPFQIRRYFDESLQDGSGIDQHMFAHGRILFDPTGLVARLQEEARSQWEAGPPPLPPESAWQHRYFPADLLRDLEDLGSDDEATANLLIARIVERLIQTHCRLQRRWTSKPKRRLGELALWDAPAAQLARTALECRPLPERRSALDELAAHVLAPLGGLMPLEWQNEWEELPAPGMKDTNLAAVESYLLGLQEQDLSGVPFAPEVTFEAPLAPARLEGVEAVLQFLSGRLANIKEIQVERHIVEGEHICSLWVMEVYTPPATLRVCEYFRVIDGRIHEIRNYYDPRPVTEARR